MPRILFVCFFLFIPNLSFAANQLSSKELTQLCSSEDRWYGGLCNGYITGTVESLLEMREQGLIAEAFCFPPNIQRGQFIDAIRQSLEKKVDTKPAFESIVLTLREKYPCE
ncbi:Rap1a/Tai family immunity protein [Kiloniella sp. EL199]|uniref:Rap1a/Tai family immunity protein n=1 Tax=Kiloniella sp. EL199 TaxID=2107581 RepID=UPI0013C4827A|nr:Rap1a/Tai family immunity protein [Kiloniella sp. EL199]